MQIGEIGPQEPRRYGEDRPGGGTQYVAGRDAPAYDAPVHTWTGPPPWLNRPEGSWGGFATGAGVGYAGSAVAGAAADDGPLR